MPKPVCENLPPVASCCCAERTVSRSPVMALAPWGRWGMKIPASATGIDCVGYAMMRPFWRAISA